MHYLKANEYYLINMVGIRKKVPGSRWSMVNYQHFNCVKRRERGGPITGDIQHSNTDVYLQWLRHEWAFVECHNIIPKQSLCLLSGPLRERILPGIIKVVTVHSSVLQVCISYALDLMWQSFEAPFFFSPRSRMLHVD